MITVAKMSELCYENGVSCSCVLCRKMITVAKMSELFIYMTKQNSDSFEAKQGPSSRNTFIHSNVETRVNNKYTNTHRLHFLPLVLEKGPSMGAEHGLRLNHRPHTNHRHTLPIQQNAKQHKRHNRQNVLRVNSLHITVLQHCAHAHPHTPTSNPAYRRR